MCVALLYVMLPPLQWDTGRGQYAGGGQAGTPQGGNVSGGGYSAPPAAQSALPGQYSDAQLAQYAASSQMQYQGGGQQGMFGTGSSPQVLKVATDCSSVEIVV